MPNPTPNPYKTREAFEKALRDAGSLRRLAVANGVSIHRATTWARDLGATTRAGTTGRANAKPCPWATGDELEQAISDAGSLRRLSVATGYAEATLRRWAANLGASTRTDKIGRPPVDGTVMLRNVNDQDLDGMLGTLGAEGVARVFDLSVATVRNEAEGRGLSATAKASPRAAMFARRVRDLEQREEALAELREDIRYAAELAAAEPAPELPAATINRKRERRAVDLCLHVSDMQYGEHVGADTPGGDYSPEVFEEERLPRYLEAVEALIENAAYANPIRRVWVCQGGDFVEGHDVFHGSAAWHLAEGYDAGTQVVRLSRVWASAVARIAARAVSVGADCAVVGVVGNHGVHGGKKGGGSAAPPSLNYDYLTYEMVAAQLEGMPNGGHVAYYDREPRKAVYIETVGGIVAMTHGQEDRGGGIVGVPITTGYRNSMSARLATDVDPILELKGHYHRPMTLTVAADRMTAWNGAWIGANNLSIGRGGASSPSQNVHVIHPEHGLIGTHRVRLAGRVEAPVDIVTA